MKDHYEVTIGIPVYRSVKYIKETIFSALGQTFPDIEFLIVDDCGNDGSMDVISLLQSSHSRGDDIRILRNDKNRGVSYSRNLIIDEAKGSYLYFMDSDDLIEPDTIRILHDALIQNQVQIVYASYEIIDKVGKTPPQVYKKASLILKGEGKLAIYAFKNNHVFHVSVCNSLINLLFLRQTGIRFIEANYWEDMAFTTELVIKVGKAVLLSDVTYHYNRWPDSLSHYQNRLHLEKWEILKNVFVVDYIKEKCHSMRGMPYLPYLGYVLEMNSFYMVCHIFKLSHNIVPPFTYQEMRNIMRHPLSIQDIVRSHHKLIANIVYYLLGKMPILFFVPSIWLAGKLKRVL